MRRRLYVLFIGFILLLALLAARLTQIQILESERFASVNAKQQRIILDGEDTRGTIFDRNGNRLTGADESFIYIIKKEVMDATAARIFQLIDADKVENESKRYYVYRSTLFSEEAAYVLKRDYDAFIIKGAARYEEEQPAVHIIGHINETDGTGASGLEKAFNEILSKKRKEVYASVDGRRMIIPGLGIFSTVENPDCGIITTLDLKIQKKAEQVLKDSGRSGAIIVVDPRNGEVLASASTPSYDPSRVEEYLDSNNEELINKVTQSLYPPGSIFKIIVAAAALESGAVNEESVFFCKGYEEINGVRINCLKEEGHGEISLRDAFSKSCNSAFIQIGQLTGGEEILKMAEAFGLGEKAFRGTIEEKTGLLPGIQDIQGAGIGNLSIGQGKLLVTPAQAARITAIIASGGTDYGLSLVKGTTEGGETKYFKRMLPRRVISKKTAELITSWMIETVDRGTANNLKDVGVTVAGKTGSAEAAYRGEMVVHGWFTGFFPALEPQYVITVFVEAGGSGRSSAVPLFRQMAEYLH